MTRRVCFITGSGDLVPQLISAALGHAVDFEVFTLTGRTDLAGARVTTFAPDALDDVFAAVRAGGYSEALLAGYVKPPTWDALRRHPALAFGEGDKVGVARMASRLEEVFPALTGARLAGIHEVAPELLVGEELVAGTLSDQQRAGAFAALQQARELGWRDNGQAIVVAPDGAVEAEDPGGTDALLQRVAARRKADTGEGTWILAKAIKPQQPMSMDVPVIGPSTIENAQLAGISVIVVQAGGALVVYRDRVRELAEAAGIAVAGLRLDEAKA